MSLSLISTTSHKYHDFIEWETLLRKVTTHAHFEHTTKSLRFLSREQALASFETTSKILAQFESVQHILTNAFQKISPSEELYQRILLLKKSIILNASELNYVATSFEGLQNLVHGLSDIDLGIEMPSGNRQLELTIKQIRSFIGLNGSIQYDRHPKLKPIFVEMEKTTLALREKTLEIAKSSEFSSILVFDQYDIINDRFVLAVRSDSYKADLGMIISRSHSGLSLFVEPPAIRNLSNKRIQLIANLDEALNSILLALSQSLHECFSSINDIFNYLFLLDLSYAKSSFAYDFDCCRPHLTEGPIELRDFFHPLIKNPIKNDLKLLTQHKGLVLSGPNTGGKTVALKTICLSLLLTRMGLFVPAKQASLPFAEQIFYFSHDQQSLEQGLSSFSSEVTQYIALVNEVTDNSYIFIDEIFNSTSSEEASALAVAFFKELQKQADCKIFVSSHHQMLKTSMHLNKEFISSHVGFDKENGLPTYKIHYGSPGSSLALAIFKQLCLKANFSSTIQSEAEHLLENKHIEYEALLENVSHKEHELDGLIQSNKQLNSELKNQKNASEGLLFLERQGALEKYKQELHRKISSIENYLYELKANPPENIKKIEKKIHDLRQEASKNDQTPFQLDFLGEQGSATNILQNKTYYCTLTKCHVEVVSLNTRKNQAQIKKGSLTIWVPFATLHGLNKEQPKSQPKVTVHVNRTSAERLTYDCRGHRLDEFQKIVFKGIEDLLCGDIPYLSIIHGHGDGILKSWLRDFLKKQGDFNWESSEGNDGETIIKLK